MRFIDLSTIVPPHLIRKLSLLGLKTSPWNYILDFWTGRPQSAWIKRASPEPPHWELWPPQSCVLSQLLFSLLTHTCESLAPINHIIKFTNDIAVLGLIDKNYESAYREEKQQLTHWCRGNNLSLNVDKAREIIDFNKPQIDHSPLNTDRSFVGIVKNTKYLDYFFACQRTSQSPLTPAA